MELVKFHSNTNYLIPWCLGFSAYKMRTVALISLGSAKKTGKLRVLLTHNGTPWVDAQLRSHSQVGWVAEGAPLSTWSLLMIAPEQRLKMSLLITPFID